MYKYLYNTSSNKFEKLKIHGAQDTITKEIFFRFRNSHLSIFNTSGVPLVQKNVDYYNKKHYF